MESVQCVKGSSVLKFHLLAERGGRTHAKQAPRRLYLWKVFPHWSVMLQWLHKQWCADQAHTWTA